MKKREYISTVLTYTGCNSLISRLRYLLPQDLTILAYHRVMDIDPETYPFDQTLVSANIDDFEWQLQYLKKNYNIISFQQMIAHLNNQTPLPKKPLILTFDDGFNDNYYNVFPLAKKYDVPFTVFLSTSYIGSKTTFWFDKAAYIFAKADVKKITLPAGGSYQLPSSLHGRRECYIQFVEKIKYQPNSARLLALEELDKHYGDVYDNAPIDDKKLSQAMTWDQVLEMSAAGVEFGGHGLVHTVLTTLQQNELSDEIAHPKTIIEEHIKKTAPVFSYPNGLAMDFNDNIKQLASNSGHDCAVCYIPGANPVNTLSQNLFNLKRVHIERAITNKIFPFMLNFPNRIV